MCKMVQLFGIVVEKVIGNLVSLMIGVLNGESVNFSQLGLFSELDRDVDEDEAAVVDDDDAVAVVEDDGVVVAVEEGVNVVRSSGKEVLELGKNFLKNNNCCRTSKL